MSEKLAIHGGPKAKTTPNIPMYPGGLEIGDDEKKEVMEVLDSKYLFRYYGPEGVPSKVKAFEDAFKEKMGSPFALATSSCTGALLSALVACGVGPGDEVIVSGYTFFASCAVIVAAKGIPVICEVDETLTIDPVDLEKKITPATKAVIITHMRGVPCNMDAIMPIIKKYNLKLIEDCAQAVGVTYKGQFVGTFGDCGCFSFQYHKVITAGEGGMILCKDERIYNRCCNYHDTGACWRPQRFAAQRFEGELFVGSNYRMSELCGAVMLAQLRRLDYLCERLRHNQKRIISQIDTSLGVKPRPVHDAEGDGGICIMLYLNDKEKVADFAQALKAEGVACGALFDAGIPDWHFYAHWRHIIEKMTPNEVPCPWECPYHTKKNPNPVNYSADMCPNSIAYLSRVIHIHVPAQMTDEDCDMIAKAINKVAAVLA